MIQEYDNTVMHIAKFINDSITAKEFNNRNDGWTLGRFLGKKLIPEAIEKSNSGLKVQILKGISTEITSNL